MNAGPAAKVDGESTANAASSVGVGDVDVESQEAVLQRLAENPQIEGVFPVYGAVKAGKSTFLSCLLRQEILPAQALPMTSIPIKVSHVPGAALKLEFPQLERWTACLADFASKLKTGTLRDEVQNKRGDEALHAAQEEIRANRFTFRASVTGRAAVAKQLTDFSHFIRLLWRNNIDYERDHGVSMRLDLLPVVQMDMPTFRAAPVQRFSFLDTPGINEQRAEDALRKVGAQVMGESTGCIFCVAWDQVQATQMWPLYKMINDFMKGKKVVAVVTHMDGFLGGDSERQGVIDSVKQNLNPDILDNFTLHFTSGAMLKAMFDLNELLQQYGHHPAEFQQHVLTDNSGRLFKLLVDLCNFGMLMSGKSSAELVATCRDLVTSNLAKLGWEDLLHDIMSCLLYTSDAADE